MIVQPRNFLARSWYDPNRGRFALDRVCTGLSDRLFVRSFIDTRMGIGPFNQILEPCLLDLFALLVAFAPDFD
jgi:hypothetical protein